MKFREGESGNPNGRPKGAVSKRTQLAKLLEPHAEELINKAVELAKGGEINALRLCIERLVPKAKHESITLDIPNASLRNPEALLSLSNEIITDMAAGKITPEQAQQLFTVLRHQGELIALHELKIMVEKQSELINEIRNKS